MSSSPAVLKQQAAALELKKQPEKALALYQQLLAEHGGSEDVDVALRNRVGDLHLRVGQIDEAIALFERSADEYALSGFLNNAIALCNKILRQRPGHVPTLRRLARFSAEKGMVVDAQRHYLSVAEALEKLGQHGEALKALSEFAELSPEDVHVRSVVVEQLLRAGRKPDALPHLTVLHRLHATAGRTDEAEGVAQVAREIDDTWVPESEQTQQGKRADLSLILIDSDDDFGMLETSPMLGTEFERPSSLASLDGLESTGPAAVEMADLAGSQPVDGFEATSLDPELAQAASAAAPADPQVPTAITSASIGDEALGFDADTLADSVGPVAAIGPDDLDVDAPFEMVDKPTAMPATELLDDFVPSFGTREVGTPASPAVPAPGVDDLLFDLDMTEPVETAPAAANLGPAPAPPTEVRNVEPASEAPFRPKRPTPSYVNLADILREEEPTSSRMTIGEPKQTGDEEADFQHILSEFRDGIEKMIPADDAESHFDLGIAFREMGLLDDAIAEFQIASRSRLKRVESIEALGGCFMDKGEPAVAASLLKRALDESMVTPDDDILRGVLYLLGRASEAIGAREDGLRYYQRVYAVDIRFRDVAARIQTLQQPA
jgi:tetratricopeptide (TPR) repeat protein